MDLRAVTGNVFPEPYDMYYANFRRVCASWMKSLPKLAKCPSELEDYFKILQRTITHPTIEPRFQLNSYLKYSFFLDSPIRRYNGIRAPSAAPRDPMSPYMKSKLRALSKTKSETPIAGSKDSKTVHEAKQTHLTNSSNLMRCINSSKYVLKHLEIVTLYLNKFTSRIKKLKDVNDLKITDPHSGLAQVGGFCAEIHSISGEALLGTSSLALTAAIGFEMIVDFFKDPNALLSLFANPEPRYKIPTEEDNTYARIKIQVCLDLVLRSFERIGKPGFIGGWTLKTGHNLDIISPDEIETVLMALMDVFLVLTPMTVNLLEVFRVLVHSDCVEKSYLLKVIRSFNAADQDKLCLTIQELSERVKKIHRLFTTITLSTHRIVKMVIPNTADYPVTELPPAQPSCLDFYNDSSLDLPHLEKVSNLRPKSASAPTMQDEVPAPRIRHGREPLKAGHVQMDFPQSLFNNSAENQSTESQPEDTPPSSTRSVRPRRRSIISRAQKVSSVDVSTDFVANRPATKGDRVRSRISIKSIPSKQPSSISKKKLSQSKQKMHEMSGDTDKERGVDMILDTNHVEIEDDLDFGLELLFRKEDPLAGIPICGSSKEICSMGLPVQDKVNLDQDLVNNNMDQDLVNNNFEIELGPIDSKFKFNEFHSEPPGSERFDEILDKISELRKEVSGAKTFEIRREGVFKVYEVKHTESGRQLYELHDAIEHPVNYVGEGAVPYPPLPHYKHLNYVQKFEDDDGNTETYEDGHIDRFASKLHVELTESELLEANLTPEQRAKAIENKEIARYKQIFGGSRTYFDLMEVWEKTKPAPKIIEEEEEEEENEKGTLGDVESSEDEEVVAESHAEYYR